MSGDDLPAAGPDSSITPDKIRGRLAEELRDALARGADLKLSWYAKKYGLSVAEVGRILDGVRAMASAVAARPDAARAAPPAPPVLPEDYEVLGELGRGAMGVVYRARQRSMDRVVAVKVLLPGTAIFANLADRFRREVKALAKLRHPHIVAVHEVGDAGGHPYFSMDLVEGSPLHDLVHAGEVTPTRAVALMTQVASAIAYTHAHGLVHRDLKPGNILVDGKGDAFVVDFGLARDTAIDGQLTGTGQILGTPAYMSPEQARGDAAQIGEASDVYAMGAVLYECLTRRAPFEGRSLVETIRAVAQDEPVPPRKIDPRIPRDLEVVCLSAMAKEPQSRYPSAQAFQEDLERFVEGLPIRARPVSPAERLRRWGQRNPVVLTSLTAVLVVLAAALWVTGYFLKETLRERNEKAEALGKEKVAREGATKERDAKTAALDRAEANLAVARAMAALDRDPGTAVVLAREAVRRAPTAEASAVLLDALSRNREVRRYAKRWTSFELIGALDLCAPVVAPQLAAGRWADPDGAAAAALHGRSPSCAAASPDRRTVAVTGTRHDDIGVRLLDAATLAERAAFACDANPNSLTFSRDGRTLVATFAERAVQLDAGAPAASSSSLSHVVALDAGTLKRLAFIAFSASEVPLGSAVEDVTPGRFFVWGETTLLAWTPGTDPSRVHLEGADAKGFAILGCVFDGSRVVAVVSTPTTVNGAPGLAVRAIDAASGRTVGTVDVRGEKALLSPAGNALLAFGERDVVAFADLRNFRAVERKLRLHTSGGSFQGVRDSLPHGSAFTRDGALVALSGGEKGDGGVWIGDPVTGESRVAIEGDFGGLARMRFLNDDRWLAADEYGIDAGAVHVWNVRGPAAIGPCAYGGGPLPAADAPIPDRAGEHVWSVTKDALVDFYDGTRRPLQFTEGARTVEGVGWVHAYAPTSRAFAIAEAGGTGAVLFVDRDDLRVVRRWDVAASVPHEEGESVWPSDLEFDGTGARLAVRAALEGASTDTSWVVLDLATSTTRRGAILGMNVDEFRLSRDGRRVFASSNPFVRVWDVETGAVLADLAPRADAESTMLVTTLGLSGPSGATVAVGTRQGVVAIYEGERLRRTFTAQTQLGWIAGIEVSDDGAHLIARDLDGRVELWRLTDGSRVVRVPNRLRSSGARFAAGGRSVVMDADDGYWRWPIDLLAAADEFVCAAAAMPQWERAGRARDAGSVELRALEIVDGLRSRRGSPTRPFKDDLAHAIDDPEVFPGDLRAAAREILAAMKDDEWELNGLAWDVAARPGASAARCRDAVAWARRAAELRPSDGDIVNTLGATLYRAGEWAAARETLERAIALREQATVADLAFLAMVQTKLGRADDAKRTLGLLLEAIKDEDHTKDEATLALAREAEETVGR